VRSSRRQQGAVLEAPAQAGRTRFLQRCRHFAVWPATSTRPRTPISSSRSGCRSITGMGVLKRSATAALRAPRAIPRWVRLWRSGFATASTDTGHGPDPDGNAMWAVGHPEKVIDFGYRAVHEMTVKSKAAVKAFYGSDPKYSYWNGCSEGGRQGMGEAERYPADFNGILDGDPVFQFVHGQSRGIWNSLVVYKDPSRVRSGCEIRNRLQGRDGQVRCSGWRERRRDQRSAAVPLRSRRAAVQRRRRARLPDGGQVRYIKSEYEGSVNPAYARTDRPRS
jgi:hypothetical protein